MKKIMLMLAVLVLSVSALSALGNNESRTGFNVALSGGIADPSYGAVGAGLMGRHQLFELPLYNYADFTIGYPFGDIHVQGESDVRVPFSMTIREGLMWRFDLKENLDLFAGLGIFVDTYAEVTREGLNFAFFLGVDPALELHWYFSESWFLAAGTNLSVSLADFQLDLRSDTPEEGDDKEDKGLSVTFHPSVHVSVGWTW